MILATVCMGFKSRIYF